MNSFRFPTLLLAACTGTIFALTVDFGAAAWAQVPSLPPENNLQKPLLNFDAVMQRDTNSTAGSAARVRLFGMPTGFLRDPFGLDSDDPAPPGDATAPRGSSEEDLNGFLVSMGNYNPYFDMRRPDDPR